MIYRVVLDDLYDLHTSDINCMLLNPSLELEMNSAGSFNFTLPPKHPSWDRIEILKSTIDVYEDDDLIFTGRVANIDKNWNNERVVECEGALAYFNDSIHRQMKWETPLPIASEDPTVHNFLKDILDNHNVFVGNATNRQIHIGHIYVDPFLVTREVDYDTTLDILNRMCIDTNGGYFMIRKDPETHLLYLDWLKDFTEESGQPASFGVNLLDFNTGLHAADICTGVLARGATVNDQVVTLSNVELVDETTYPDMSVDHYTDRYQDILWHREGVSKFGQVVQVHDFPDCQTDWKNGGQVVANSLFEEARKWLEEKNTKIESIEVEVAELSWLQEGVPKYKLGQIVEVLDDAHMAGEPYEVRRLPMYKLSCDLSSGSKKVTLGRPPKKELTQISASNSDSSTLSSGNSSGSSSGGGSGSGEECKVHDVRVDGTSVVSNKVANISLTGKADVSIVNALAATVATKADTSTVNALATAVAGKQNQIEFNTAEAATETLTRLKADGTVYNLGGGTEVEANPSETATDELEKIRIGQTIYSLPEGGGGVTTITPTKEHATSERNSTAQDTYTATDDMYAMAINLSVNGEASSYTQTCSIATTGTILDTVSNHRDNWSNPDRNYAITVDSLNLESGDDVIFSNTGTANYIVRLRGVVGLNQEIRILDEISNVITADNNNNSRTVQLDPTKVYMVLAFGTSGNGGNAGDINVSSTGLMTFTTLSAQSVKMICAFVMTGSSVSISFGSETNYYSKGHIIYEVDVKKVEYATKEDLENYVVANPEDTPTDDISSIKIGDTIYSIAGGSGNQKYSQKVLYEGTTSINTYTLSDSINNYDLIYVYSTNSNKYDCVTMFRKEDAIESINDSNIKLGVFNDTEFEYFRASSATQLESVRKSGRFISKIVGMKIGDSVIYLPALYSEEEREVGVWVNGKPLYQRTYILRENGVDKYQWNYGVLAQIGLTGVDEVWLHCFYADRRDGSGYIDSAIVPNEVIFGGYYQSDGSIYFSSTHNPANIQVTLCYTKTADQPGSGTWTPEGQLAHHYSLNEQVIGTWVDNSTLYEITVNKGSVAPSGTLVIDRKTMLMNDVLTYLKTPTNSLLYYTNQSDVIWEVKAENYGTDTAWNDLVISGSGGSPSIVLQDGKDTLDVPFGTVGTYTLPDITGDKTLYTVLRMDSTQVSGDYGGLIGFMYADNQQNTPMFMIRNDGLNNIYRAVYGASWDYNTGKSGLIDHVLVISIDSTNKIVKFFVDGESAGQAPYYNYGNLRLGARLAGQSTNVGVKYIGVTKTFDSNDTIINNTKSIANYYGV